jgi:hypothetical protein
MVNFRPKPGSTTVRDVSVLNRLKTIGFYWGTIYHGKHSFVGLGGDTVEFEWLTCPHKNPLKDNTLEGFMDYWARYNRASGIIVIPPGTSVAAPAAPATASGT